jgi:hypothetical protein
LEYWNDGLMGSGKMEQGFVGKIFLEMELIDINSYGFLFYINIPIFHHSIIPCAGRKHQTSKPSCNLIN